MYVPASIRSAMERLLALDGDDVGARALDRRAHLVEHARELFDLGLPSGVGDPGPPAGERRRAHQVLGAGDGRDVEVDVGAAQATGGHHDLDVAVIERDLRAHCLQALEVLVDRARADRTASGERHPGAPVARHERAEHEHRCAHLLHELVGRVGLGDRDAAHLDHRRAHLDAEAHVAEQLGGGLDVAEVGHVAEHVLAVGEE
jgi:hypothetical protein